MKKILVILLFVTIPVHAMFFRAASKTARTRPVSSASSVKYQKPVVTKRVLSSEPIGQKNEPISKSLVSHEEIPQDNKKKPKTNLWATPSKGSWAALFAALGLGWLWYNSEDEEKAKEAAEDVLRRSRLTYADPYDQFDQFIRRYGTGPVAEQLFEQMIDNGSILWNMVMQEYNGKQIPTSVVPFIKRHYYTLALSTNGSIVLRHLMKTDTEAKNELTTFAIRDMEKLCQNAHTDYFFSSLMMNNPEAVNGLVKKAEGHVEELIATNAGKMLIDGHLIQRSVGLAKERAMLLVDTSKTFDLSAFNTCMKIIKDDSVIEQTIQKTYNKDDLPSLLRKLIYQKHCQQCVKDDFSQASVSLKSLADNINHWENLNTMYHYIVPHKGLSHMVIKALNKEDKYKNDYFVFYHGQPSKLAFQQRLFSWLVTKTDDVVLPIIYPFPQTKEEQRSDKEYLSKRKGSLVHYGGDRTHSLYAVIDLFSNITLNLAAINSPTAQMPSITTEKAFKDAHQEELYTRFASDLKELEREYNKLNQEGQLLQFRVKKDKLEEFIFPSPEASNDVVTKDFPNLRAIVEAFQKSPEKIKNRGYSVGIIINSALSDPNSGITCSIINSVDPAEWAAYEKKEKALRNKIENHLNSEKKTQTNTYQKYWQFLR